MRAFYVRAYGSASGHAIESIERTGPGVNEVLIRTQAIALNYPDLLMLEGKYQVHHETPFVPGRDAAGIVERVGAGVTGLRAGDRIMCQVARGAWAEEIVAPVSRCYPMPQSASFVDAAAAITPYNTAYVALVARARVRAGEIVIVTGASGSVGTALIQLAKAMGAFVIAAVSSAHKSEYLTGLGADAVVITTTDDLKRKLRESVLAATGGREAHVVCDTVGGEVFTAGLRALGFDGRMVVIGFTGAQIPEVRVNYLLLRNLSVIGAPVDSHFEALPRVIAEGTAFIRDLYEQRRLRPTIKAVLPFEDFPEALRQAADATVPGRIVVTL
jgi:NADPH2:quinone reductase